jgi:hypothetical protein
MLAIATAIHPCIDLVDGWRPTSAGQSPGQRDVGHGLDVYIWHRTGGRKKVSCALSAYVISSSTLYIYGQ